MRYLSRPTQIKYLMKSELLYQTNLNQISQKTFNCKIFNQTNLNKICHKAFNHEMFSQTNQNQISHKTSTMIESIRPT